MAHLHAGNILSEPVDCNLVVKSFRDLCCDFSIGSKSSGTNGGKC